MAEYYIPPELSKTTKKSIDNFVDLSKRTPEDYHQSNMRGVDATRGFLANDNSFEKSLGMNDVGLSKSIRDSADQKYYDKVNRYQRESRSVAQEQYSKRLLHAADLVNQELQYNQERQMLLYQAKMARKKARAQVIGTVLGIGGAVVGGVATMSPQGAMVGYQVGQGLGSASAY